MRALSETIGKLGSYAGLLYAGDTSNPENAKFYGDIQERITAITTDLIFFELELNKIEDAPLARALTVPALAHYGRGSPICARRSPISSTSSSSACSTRRRSPRTAPGAGSSARR